MQQRHERHDHHRDTGPEWPERDHSPEWAARAVRDRVASWSEAHAVAPGDGHGKGEASLCVGEAA